MVATISMFTKKSVSLTGKTRSDTLRNQKVHSDTLLLYPERFDIEIVLVLTHDPQEFCHSFSAF